MTPKDTYLSKRNELQFWRNLDKYLVAFQLNDGQDIANGCIKDNLGLIEAIPKPETGYHYLDVVYFTGPIGKRPFKDEEIDLYKAGAVHKKSNIPTFSFEAILPKHGDSYNLIKWFIAHGQFVQFPWSSKDNDMDWRKGYCIADNIEQAVNLLKDFVGQDNNRQMRNIH